MLYQLSYGILTTQGMANFWEGKNTAKYTYQQFILSARATVLFLLV
jgi:hypothetical protein